MSQHRVCAPIDVTTGTSTALRRAVADETATHVMAPYAGPYAAYVMRPFRYPVASRFSDGTFGVHYSANRLEVARAEHGFHLARALVDARMPAMDMRRAYLTLDFLSDLPEVEPSSDLLHPDDYTASQRYGCQRYSAGDPGLHFPSVRSSGGRCAGLFRPALATTVYLITDSLRCHWAGDTLTFA